MLNIAWSCKYLLLAVVRKSRAGQTTPDQHREPRREQDAASGLRVSRRQAPGVKTAGLSVAKMSSNKARLPHKGMQLWETAALPNASLGAVEVLDLPSTACAWLSMQGSPAGTVQSTSWFLQAPSRNNPHLWRTAFPRETEGPPPCCREQARGQKSPSAAEVHLPGKDGEGFSASPCPCPWQRCLLFLSLGLVRSAQPVPAPGWVISCLVLHAREAVSPSFQAAGAVGG